MDTNSPLVSVGIITRNRGHLIAQAIEQIRQQTYKNLEIIISDNHSTDQTQEVCEAYTSKDPRITYYCQKENIGMYNNFNFVLNKASGTYFLWATDDDEWDRQYIEKMVHLFRTYPTAVVATSNYKLTDGQHTLLSTFDFPPLLVFPDSIYFFIGNAVLVTYGLLRTDVIRKAGGFFRYPWPISDGVGETIQNVRVLTQGDLAFCREILWTKRDSGSSFKKFTIISLLSFTADIRFRIKRYTSFFILYFYDIVVLIKDVSRLPRPLSIKRKILWYCVQHYMRSNVQFLKDILYGVCIALASLCGYTGQYFKTLLRTK